jgi:hypothetical protein
MFKVKVMAPKKQTPGKTSPLKRECTPKKSPAAKKLKIHEDQQATSSNAQSCYKGKLRSLQKQLMSGKTVEFNTPKKTGILLIYYYYFV